MTATSSLAMSSRACDPAPVESHASQRDRRNPMLAPKTSPVVDGSVGSRMVEAAKPRTAVREMPREGRGRAPRQTTAQPVRRIPRPSREPLIASLNASSHAGPTTTSSSVNSRCVAPVDSSTARLRAAEWPGSHFAHPPDRQLFDGSSRGRYGVSSVDALSTTKQRAVGALPWLRQHRVQRLAQENGTIPSADGYGANHRETGPAKDTPGLDWVQKESLSPAMPRRR